MHGQLLRCDVCGELRKFVLVGPHWERDTQSRKFQRLQCATCNAHIRVYEDQPTPDDQMDDGDSVSPRP